MENLSLNSKVKEQLLSTEVTDEDRKDAWTDDSGVLYSKDGNLISDAIFAGADTKYFNDGEPYSDD